MASKKVENPETKVNATIDMNDRDYLNDLLSSEKCLVKDMATAMTEASNETLFNKMNDIFDDVKKLQRNLFELAFENGWYKLEEADETKINEKETQLNTLNDELSN